jgi:hypothetical protein
MIAPFPVKYENGLVHISAPHDAAFRKALMAGVPPSLRSKMQIALAATPGKGAAQHARRYFADEADKVFSEAQDLAQVLHRFLAEKYQLVGLLDWLTATGYGNDYRMIRVFYEWSQMPADTKPQIILPNG